MPEHLNPDLCCFPRYVINILNKPRKDPKNPNPERNPTIVVVTACDIIPLALLLPGVWGQQQLRHLLGAVNGAFTFL